MANYTALIPSLPTAVVDPKLAFATFGAAPKRETIRNEAGRLASTAGFERAYRSCTLPGIVLPSIYGLPKQLGGHSSFTAVPGEHSKRSIVIPLPPSILRIICPPSSPSEAPPPRADPHPRARPYG